MRWMAGMRRAAWPLWGGGIVALAALIAGAIASLAGDGPLVVQVAGAAGAATAAFVLLWIAKREAEHGERMRQVAESCAGVEACFSPDGQLEWISPSIAALTGYSAQTCLGVPDVMNLLVHELDRPHCRRLAEHARRGEAGSNVEVRLVRNDGEEVWVACHWRPVLDERGRVAMIRVSAENVQARKRAELKLLETVAALRRSQGLSEYYLSRSQDERMRLQALLDVIDAGILFVDADRRVHYANPAMVRLWQLGEADSLMGMRDASLLERVLPRVAEPQEYRRHVAAVRGRSGRTLPFEFAFRDGRIVREVSAMVRGARAGRSLGRLWIFEDITEQRRAAEALVQLAERDALTNLYNRRRFHEALDISLAAAERTQTRVGLMIFDLDGFKPINDRLGHQAGDAILIEVAGAVRSVVRRNEQVFRIGGDEFAIVVPDANEMALSELAQRVVSEVAGVGREDARISASLGIACYPGDGRSQAQLMAAADAAMYRAKSAGRNGWQDSAGRGVSGGRERG